MLGTLLAVDLFASGGLPASGPWWLDTRPLPQSLAAALLGLSAALLILFAARGTLPALVRAVAIGCLGLLVAIALKNATIYYGLLQRGDLHAGPPIAFGLHVAVCFGVVLLAICSRQRPLGFTATLLVLVGFNAAMLSFPIAQIACLGTVDARRPASAVIVFGPRSFEPHDCLDRRIKTAAALLSDGLAPRLILTGGTDESLQAMRRTATELGVSEAAIELLHESDAATAISRLEPRFPTTNNREPTVLGVSDPDHLPRLAIEADRRGMQLATVPATGSRRPVRGVLLREILELWRCYAHR